MAFMSHFLLQRLYWFCPRRAGAYIFAYRSANGPRPVQHLLGLPWLGLILLTDVLKVSLEPVLHVLAYPAQDPAPALAGLPRHLVAKFMSKGTGQQASLVAGGRWRRRDPSRRGAHTSRADFASPLCALPMTRLQ